MTSTLVVASSCGPSGLQDPASLLPPTFTSRRAKTAVFCEVSPHKGPVLGRAEGRPGRGNYSPDYPFLRPWHGVTSSWAPPPQHRGGRAPGARIGTGAAPEPPKTPMGLLGLVVVAGGSRTARYWAVWTPYPGDTRVGAACAIAVSRNEDRQTSFPPGSVERAMWAAPNRSSVA